LSYELQELPSVSQVSWKMILRLSTLLLVRFGTLANPVTSFSRCCPGFVVKHKAIWTFVSLLNFVMCFILFFWVFFYAVGQ